MRKSRERLFLCIGGPYDGQFRTSAECQNADYEQFNRAVRIGARRGGHNHTAVFLHGSKLKGTS